MQGCDTKRQLTRRTLWIRAVQAVAGGELRGEDKTVLRLGGPTMVKRGVLPADYSRVCRCDLVLTYTFIPISALAALCLCSLPVCMM